MSSTADVREPRCGHPCCMLSFKTYLLSELHLDLFNLMMLEISGFEARCPESVGSATTLDFLCFFASWIVI